MKDNNILINDLIKNEPQSLNDLASFKRRAAKKYKISCPSNIELLKVYHKLLKNGKIKRSEKIESLLKTKPIRSFSGIVNISVLTKPYPCPGKCIYCPKELNIPKSYVSGEPAVERAKKFKFNPYLQVQKRIEMLESQGHPTDKIELRIVGGTWSYYPKQYQGWFIKECFRACNEFNKVKTPNSKFLIFNFKNLEKEQKKNEKAKHRIVGLSVETRPDFIDEKEIKKLREFGVTMVELGVQSIYDDVLKINSRGHDVKEIILATKLLKNAGFKILYQMMVNLAGSNLKKDEKMFEEIFSNPDFQPDYLKIYPCALLKGTQLYRLYKVGKYKPYSKKELIELIKKIKKKIPYYVRIQRITRDIPAPIIITGPAKISNLRQIIAAQSKKENWHCHCIRCREIMGNYNPNEKIYLFCQDYEASQGKEFFLSFENKNRTKLYSLLRLRIPEKNKDNLKVIFPALKKAALIREVQTFGEMVEIGTQKIAPQHKGLGKALIKKAEKITNKEFNFTKIAVISGVGVRKYWQKLGYKLKNTYMVKKI